MREINSIWWEFNLADGGKNKFWRELNLADLVDSAIFFPLRHISSSKFEQRNSSGFLEFFMIYQYYIALFARRGQFKSYFADFNCQPKFD